MARKRLPPAAPAKNDPIGRVLAVGQLIATVPPEVRPHLEARIVDSPDGRTRIYTARLAVGTTQIGRLTVTWRRPQED